MLYCYLPVAPLFAKSGVRGADAPYPANDSAMIASCCFDGSLRTLVVDNKDFSSH